MKTAPQRASALFKGRCHHVDEQMIRVKCRACVEEEIASAQADVMIETLRRVVDLQDKILQVEDAIRHELQFPSRAIKSWKEFVL